MKLGKFEYKRIFVGIITVIAVVASISSINNRNDIKNLNDNIVNLNSYIVQINEYNKAINTNTDTMISNIEILSKNNEKLSKEIEGLVYRIDNIKNGIVKTINFDKMDLDKDGIEENILLENRGKGNNGDIYLVIENTEFLIAEDFCEPDYKLYDMKLDYIEFEEKVKVFVELSQFSNGIGSNSWFYIYEFNKDKIEQIWDSSKLEKPYLLSIIEDDKITFESNDGLLIQTNNISDIPEGSLGFDNISEIPKVVDDHYISFPVGAKVKKRDGNYYIWVGRIIRKPIFVGYYEEEYLVKEDSIELEIMRVDWLK